MIIRILELAEADLLAGYRFYERQRPGIGNYFLDTLYSDIESLSIYAGIHRQVFGYYRLLSSRFPYGVYYSMNGDVVEIWRVLDCRRRPGWIERQVKRKSARRPPRS
ncbi:MAG: type II toxin-antitoxin system RelE/ParE family toxin [Opitutaceae bacterium]|jgi:plasmid stabilization system protein ParE|nr:type II toxin-antitoxin system RelE/ParE family toxin [Opitutaceae bacterium]